MFDYLKSVIQDANTKSPSTHRYIAVLSSVSLSIGFLFCTGALIVGQPISDAVILGLAGILAALGGGTYTANKINKKGEQDAPE